MKIERWALLTLRVFLVVLFGILVFFETVSLPGQFAHLAEENPDDAHLRWPLTAITVFWVLCVQVVVVATWKLLTFVRDDRIFTEASLVWVDVILGAIGAGWVVLVGFFLWVGFQADDPGAPLLLFLIVVLGAVLGLMVVVMRVLLRQATTLRTDMESVI
jgi:hypothetical protein